MTLPTKAISFVFYFVFRRKLKFFFIAFSFFTWGIADSFYPYFLKKIVNKIELYHGLPAGIYAALAGVLVLLMLFWLTSEILLRIQGFIQAYAFPYFRKDIREAVFNYVKQHSHDYFASHFSGSIAKKLSDLPASCQNVTEIICFQFVTALTGLVLVLGMMWLTNPLFSLVLLVWLVLHFGVTAIFLKSINQLWEEHSEASSTLSGKIVDVFTNMLNVRLFARGDYELIAV